MNLQSLFRQKGHTSIKAQARANISQRSARASGGTPPDSLFDFHFASMLIRYTSALEKLLMQPAKFCSECGETLKAARSRFAPGRVACERCAPRYRGRRFLQIASLLLLISIAFAIGRYGTPPRTVYLIGTPIEPIATAEPGAASAANASSAAHETRATDAADAVVTICGAPTKSGRPCQRKVKGGGYCYQHRDKYAPKNANRAAR